MYKTKLKVGKKESVNSIAAAAAAAAAAAV